LLLRLDVAVIFERALEPDIAGEIDTDDRRDDGEKLRDDELRPAKAFQDTEFFRRPLCFV